MVTASKRSKARNFMYAHDKQIKAVGGVLGYISSGDEVNRDLD
jgi:hypothetical protein